MSLRHEGEGMSYLGTRMAAFVVALSAAPAPGVAQEAQPRVPLHGSSLAAPLSVAELLDPYRGDPGEDEVLRALDEARVGGFGAHRTDDILGARAWRRAGAVDRALSTLEAIPMAETGSLALLERARVLLETDADRDAGARAYWAGCERLDPEAQADFQYDLLAVSTPEEREAWSDGTVDPTNCKWLREFWSERAQRMAISTDERVALHYRRLAHARDWYWIPRPRLSESWADKRGRPEGIAIDDRGLMYVRMGPPETDEGFVGLGSEGVNTDFQVADLSDATPSFLTGVPDDALEERRCWPYPRADGYRIFCFSQTSASGYARADGDYKLLESIVAEPGTRFYHNYVLNSNLPDAWKRDRLRARVSSLSATRNGRFPPLRDRWEIRLDSAQARAYGLAADVKTRENIEEAIAQVPDVPALLPSVRLRVEALRFLNPSEGAWQIWTLAGVRAGDLTAAPNNDGVPTLVAGGRFSVLKGTEVEIHELAPRSMPEASLPDDAGIMFHSVFRALPGRLPLTVVIEDGNRPNAGNYLLDTLNVPAIGGLPMVSDIAIAQATGGTWTRDGETYMQITPAHVTNDDGSIHAYFEVYQVRPGTVYEVEIRLAPVELTERILRLDPSELDFRLQFSSEMTGQIGRHHLRLDLGDAAPGEYSLAVRMQDTDTKAYSLPAVTDVFVPRTGTSR